MGIEYVLASLVLAVTPGTGVLYTVTAGLSRGARAGLVAALGCTLGIVPHVAAAVTGLAALLHTSAVAFQVLKYLGVAYQDRKSTRLNSSHANISYAVFCLKKKKTNVQIRYKVAR